MQIISLPYIRDASHYFERIRHLQWPLLLDSNQRAGDFGRYDLMMANPKALIKVTDGNCYLDTGHGFKDCAQDAFSLIAEQLQDFNGPDSNTPELPFYGGVAGLFGYDFGRTLETMPNIATQDIDLPDLWVGIYPWAVICDHKHQACWLVSQLDDVESKKVLEQLQTSVKTNDASFTLLNGFSSNMTAQEYEQKFQQVIDYIYAGDCYQVCLAQRFESRYKGHPWQAFKALRTCAPTPFSAYLETDSGSVLSLSPERFLQVKDLVVETRPIKGTRPRGTNVDKDNIKAS